MFSVENIISSGLLLTSWRGKVEVGWRDKKKAVGLSKPTSFIVSLCLMVLLACGAPEKVEEMWKGPDPGMVAKATPSLCGKAPEMAQQTPADQVNQQASERKASSSLAQILDWGIIEKT